MRSGELLALDAKINIEENALFRQRDLQAWRDPSQEDPMERSAAEHDLNYVSLDGNIACMVNGAGLAMATMDLIKLHGGRAGQLPRRRRRRDARAGRGGVQADPVESGGIGDPRQHLRRHRALRLIANGIIQAVREIDIEVPVVVRLEGTNVDAGKQLLADSGLDITPADDLTDAAVKAVPRPETETRGEDE